MVSNEVERQLRRAFARLPEPSRESTRRARQAALATLPARQRRAGLGLLLAAAAVAVVLGAGAAALAATGNLHLRLGREQHSPSKPPTHLLVPPGTNGFAVVAGGKLWLATRHGLRIEGMPVSTAELSPRALFAAVGIGSSLVAMAPARRRPWTHDAGGRVLAAAWSPDGLKIAYIVRRGPSDELRLIEGDGDHDRLLDTRVSAAKPSWRGDALAVAYVSARGRPIVYDLGTDKRRSFATNNCGGRARAVAYAPAARRLAVAGTSGVAVIGRWSRPPACVAFARVIAIDSLGWLSQGELVTSDNPLTGVGAPSAIRRFGWDGAGRLDGVGAAFSAQRLRAVAAVPGGRELAVAMMPRRGIVEIFMASAPGRSGATLRLGGPLLRLHVDAATVSLIWR